MNQTQETTIKPFPADLRAAVQQAADADGLNMNDVIVAALAQAYDVPFEPTRRRASVVSQGPVDAFNLRMPKRLHKKIKQRALSRETSLRSEILDVLRDRFLRVAA